MNIFLPAIHGGRFELDFDPEDSETQQDWYEVMDSDEHDPEESETVHHKHRLEIQRYKNVPYYPEGRLPRALNDYYDVYLSQFAERSDIECQQLI